MEKDKYKYKLADLVIITKYRRNRLQYALNKILDRGEGQDLFFKDTTTCHYPIWLVSEKGKDALVEELSKIKEKKRTNKIPYIRVKLKECPNCNGKLNEIEKDVKYCMSCNKWYHKGIPCIYDEDGNIKYF